MPTLGNQGLRRQTSPDYGIVMRVTEPSDNSHRLPDRIALYDRVSWEIVTRHSVSTMLRGL